MSLTSPSPVCDPAVPHLPRYHDPMSTVILEPDLWRSREAAHEARACRLTADHRDRRRRGEHHPVEDFLFTYYPFRPGQLRRWHPGAGVGLAEAADTERAGWPHYESDGDIIRLDARSVLEARGRTVRFIRDLLVATTSRSAGLACFGLHEWAMVYRATPAQIRHAGLPLRLGSRETDEVVEAHELRCTHFDAFRFYTEPARSRNSVTPRLETRMDLEQPGCLHAGMDVYKWAFRLGPAVPGELLLDCFELAREIRELDMRASPYDLTDLGYSPVPIETAAGKAAYVAQQRVFAERAADLRHRLIAVCDRLEACAKATGVPA